MWYGLRAKWRNENVSSLQLEVVACWSLKSRYTSEGTKRFCMYITSQIKWKLIFFFLPSLVTDHKGKSEATLRHLREHGFSLHHGQSVLSQTSSDDTTLGFQKGEVLPCPELLFCSPSLTSQHWEGYGESQLKGIIWFTLYSEHRAPNTTSETDLEMKGTSRYAHKKLQQCSLLLEGSRDPGYSTPMSPLLYPVIREETLGLYTIKLAPKQNQKPILTILFHFNFIVMTVLAWCHLQGRQLTVHQSKRLMAGSLW